MLLGGLEILLGKVILGKIFTGVAAKGIATAVVKTGLGVAAKAEFAHHAVQVVNALDNASTVASVADTVNTVAVSPLTTPPTGITGGGAITSFSLDGGIDDLGGTDVRKPPHLG